MMQYRPVILGLAILSLFAAFVVSPAAAQETFVAQEVGPAAAAGADRLLPEGVVARVHGEDITEAQLLDRIARAYAHGERGREALAELVDDICVAREAARRGVTVTDAEVQAYIEKWDATVRKQSGGKATLESLYDTEEEKAEFVSAAHEFVLRQKMAREDFRSKPEEELSERYLKLWLASQRKKANVRYKNLDEGVMATVGGQNVLRQDLARRLRDKLPSELVAAVGNELVVTVASEHDARESGVTITDELIEEAMRALRLRFADDPQVRGSGVTFDQYLRQSRGYGEDNLRSDRVFRARIALRRMKRDEITDDDVRQYWQDHLAAYGERVLVRQILVPASDGGAKFQQMSFHDASQVALGAKAEVLEAAGLHLPEKERPKTSMGALLTRIAKRLATNDKARHKAGEPMIFTRQPLQGEPALEKAAFDGPLGILQGPIRSSLGYHLLMVEERRPAPEFDDVAERIRDDLLSKRVNAYELACRADTENVIRSWEARSEAE